MAKGDLAINSIQLRKDNIRYSPGWIDIETTDRTINGTLVSDVIAMKRRFTITWNNPIACAFTETQSDLTTGSYTCKLDISQTYLREIIAGNYAFSGFTITLEEV